MTKHLRVFFVLAILIPAACAAQPSPPSTTASSAPATGAPLSDATTTPTAPATGPASLSTIPVPGADAAGILWLCMPGQTDNPCEGDLSTTVVDATGKRTVETPTRAADPKIDCFYVYPTTSLQPGINATIEIDPEERAVAVAQAALFSQVCQVYAPVYPQVTIAGLQSNNVALAQVQMAYDGVMAAFDDYLVNYNHGRGFVLMGHSQGAMLLVSLIHDRLDFAPDVRKRLVSALLMGANATTEPGKTTGGDFANIPTCTSPSQVGCVVSYSSFAEDPPDDAAFGRTTSFGMLRPPRRSEQIMCVNPARPGGKGTLQPIFATADLVRFENSPKPLPSTTYVAYPNEFSGECKTSGTAAWLQVTRIGPKNATPAFSGSEGPSWGLHDLDVSLTIGNLVNLVRAEAAAYGSSRSGVLSLATIVG